MTTISFDFDPDALADEIDAAVDAFDFNLPGENQSLGRDLAVRVATGIADRSAQGLDPEGAAWKPNSDTPFHGLPGYATYKRKRYDVDRPGELGGQMLSLNALLGKPDVSPIRIVMTYGWGAKPGRTARNGTALKAREAVASDRDKAAWFTEGGRRFYELDDEISASVVKLAGERLDRHLKELGF